MGDSQECWQAKLGQVEGRGVCEVFQGFQGVLEVLGQGRGVGVFEQ